MSRSSLASDAGLLRAAARELAVPSDFDPLVQAAAGAQVVLIGEASHGTHDFYEVRALLTRRLIQEHGFAAVVCEADWPDMFRVHRYVTGKGSDGTADEALGSFRRFPAWMWRNTVVRGFVEWLREWNSRCAAEKQEGAGIFGMDLYSLHQSIEGVLGYLERVDPEAARRARSRYSCFEHFSHEPQAYGIATTFRGKEPCEDEVVSQLVELRRSEAELIRREPRAPGEDFFSAEQNARLVVNAERYYRAMFRSRDDSWNVRDRHMFETLVTLRQYFEAGRSKVVVWAHNSHLGDARATEMGERGELNVGQLVREIYGKDAYLLGFTTYSGTVTAAHEWGDPARHYRVLPGISGSYEELFHEVAVPRFWLHLQEGSPAHDLLAREKLERAIGVIYRPETERWSHYFHASFSDQFDAVVHLDETRALDPLEPASQLDITELPETYPSGV